MNGDNIITATALGHSDGLVTAELDKSLDLTRLRHAAHDGTWESAIRSAPLVTVIAVVFHHSPDIDLDPELDPDGPYYQREDHGFYLDPDQAVKLAHRLLELAAEATGAL